jgi:hypothetical protein
LDASKPSWSLYERELVHSNLLQGRSLALDTREAVISCSSPVPPEAEKRYEMMGTYESPAGCEPGRDCFAGDRDDDVTCCFPTQ